MPREPRRFFAPQAWVAGAWACDVLLEVDARGHWSAVHVDAAPQVRQGATVLPGPVLPGLVNAHSHAFQRAMAGLAEQRGAQGDDFWSWRERMYAVALRISAAQLEAVATRLYTEMLAGGYTQVCEFHYLHNAPTGAPAADPLEMSMALVRAAQRSGIGLTLLPTLLQCCRCSTEQDEPRRVHLLAVPRLDRGLQGQAAAAAQGGPRLWRGAGICSPHLGACSQP